MDVTPPQYLRTAPLKQLLGSTRAPGGGAGPSRHRGRERRVAARAAIEIVDTTEETVNVNETTPEPVEETEPAENAKNTEISVNAAEIFFFSLELKKLMRLPI